MRSVELISAILALSVPLVTAVSEDRAAPPNIVSILADDLGYGELGLLRSGEDQDAPSKGTLELAAAPAYRPTCRATASRWSKSVRVLP